MVKKRKIDLCSRNENVKGHQSNCLKDVGLKEIWMGLDAFRRIGRWSHIRLEQGNLH